MSSRHVEVFLRGTVIFFQAGDGLRSEQMHILGCEANLLRSSANR